MDIEREREAFQTWWEKEPVGDFDGIDAGHVWRSWLARAERAEAAQRVPQGWKLVPVEPTEEMHAAAVRTIVRCQGNDDFPPRVYRAMLAAAPTATEPKGEQE